MVDKSTQKVSYEKRDSLKQLCHSSIILNKGNKTESQTTQKQSTM